MTRAQLRAGLLSLFQTAREDETQPAALDTAAGGPLTADLRTELAKLLADYNSRGSSHEFALTEANRQRPDL